MTKRMMLGGLLFMSCASPGERVSDSGRAPIGVLHTLVQRLDKDGPVPVARNSTLRSGDRLAVSAVLETTKPSFLYVVLQTAAGSSEVLVPAANAPPTPTKPDALVQLPGDGKWFQLDEHRGDEVLYVVASESLLEQSAVLKLIQTATEGVRDPPPPTIKPPNRGIYFVREAERAAAQHSLFLDNRAAVVRFSYRHE